MAGAVIPPPAGTVVMAVGKGITTASTAISTIAAGFTKRELQSLAGAVDYSDDVFNLAYESVVAPYGATPEDVMGNSSNWVRSSEWTVPVASVEPTEMFCVGGVVTNA